MCREPGSCCHTHAWLVTRSHSKQQLPLANNSSVQQQQPLAARASVARGVLDKPLTLTNPLVLLLLPVFPPHRCTGTRARSHAPRCRQWRLRPSSRRARWVCDEGRRVVVWAMAVGSALQAAAWRDVAAGRRVAAVRASASTMGVMRCGRGSPTVQHVPLAQPSPHLPCPLCLSTCPPQHSLLPSATRSAAAARCARATAASST